MVFLVTATGMAADFNWGSDFVCPSYTIAGQGFVSPIETQVDGTCGAFARTALAEASYKLTRNDTDFNIDLSEQTDVNGLSWIGRVLATELPNTGGDPYAGTNKSTPDQWPLQVGWQNRMVPAWTEFSEAAPYSVATLKNLLQQYGPVNVGVDAYCYWSFGNPAPASPNLNHSNLLVGYHDAVAGDDPAVVAAGGFWILKNSWGGANYSMQLYGYVEQFGGPVAAGPSYYTGAMATATWQGSGGVWAAGASNWTSSSGAYTWVNQETAAIFNAGANNAVTLNGPAIAHALTFNAGATGYNFSGGSLTVTAGGITANESVTINSPVTVGAPQTWTTATGKTLTINGNVSTIISTLSIAGAGATTINGVIGDGGALPGNGGGLTMLGPGTLTLTGANTYSNVTMVGGGVLTLSGSNGAISSSSGITLAGGRLLLDNSTANNSNRIGSTIPLVLRGGELALQGYSTPTLQQVGSMALQAGGSTLTVAAGAGAAKLSGSTLIRSAGSTALVRGTRLGNSA